jgi:aspartate/methionine/tyrosine aminotransferase
MKLAPFLLDQWLQEHSGPQVEFNMGSSTDPHWKLGELLELAGQGALQDVLNTEVVYSRTAGRPSLRQAIAEMEAVSEEQVIVLTGGQEALFIVFFQAAEPGTNVIIPFPCFPPHRAVPESLGLEVRSYHLRPENSHRVDLDEVKRLADAKTKIFLVNSPHNPTGATLSDTEMEMLQEFAAERGIQFVSEEVYHPIYHGRETASAARLPNATVIGDFSKAFSLSGLRLGWLVERDSAWKKQYMNTREYITISNTPVTEFFAEVAVRNRDKVLARTRDEARANLQHLDRLIAEHADAIAWIRPRGGMTGFPRLIEGSDARVFCQAALNIGILVAPGDCWGVPDHFRIGFGVGLEWFHRAVERLGKFLQAWAHKNAQDVAAT